MSSEPAALRLYAGEISAGLAAMLGGPQWGRKKAAAEALVKLTEVRFSFWIHSTVASLCILVASTRQLTWGQADRIARSVPGVEVPTTPHHARFLPAPAAPVYA